MHKPDKHLTPEQIAQCADAINNGTYEQLPPSVRHHLQACNICGAEVVNVAEMASGNSRSSAKELPTSKAGRSIWSKHSKLLIGIAASVVIIAGALILGVNGFFEPQNPNTVAEQTDRSEGLQPEQKQMPVDCTGLAREHNAESPEIQSNAAETHENVQADNDTEGQLLAVYEPDPKLEKLYNNMEGSYRGESTNVETPRVMHYSREEKLAWSNPSDQFYFVEIFDNRGNEIFRRETTKKSLAVPELERGLYYWKLIDAEFELQFVGKIIVEE